MSKATQQKYFLSPFLHLSNVLQAEAWTSSVDGLTRNCTRISWFSKRDIRAEIGISPLVFLNEVTMIAAKNGVLESLAECRYPKVNFRGWRFVQNRRKLGDFLETVIQKTRNSFLKGRETCKYQESEYTYSIEEN